LKESLIGKSLNELKELFVSIGEKPYRATQLYDWIYKKHVFNFNDMLNFSETLREKLEDSFVLFRSEVAFRSELGDTVKYLWKLSDGQLIESVLMPSEDRMTICISSQVGCAVDCKFCATGQMGFKRHLDSGEILEQVLQISAAIDNRVSNIVFMGMGEPFLNYENVIKASEILHDPEAMNISTRRITISTSGILPIIYRYADEKQPYRLAISLNHVDQLKREKVMPITKKYSIAELIDSAKYYNQMTGKRITFEYVMLKNDNISDSDARKLVRLCHGIDCKVNLIPCNSLDSKFLRPTEDDASRFKSLLEKSGVNAFIRKTRGREIEAACGMLHNTFNKQEVSSE
jgi:23S rRNA (adenine2503-C2)-methyltransferase